MMCTYFFICVVGLLKPSCTIAQSM